jgi:predicted  nucleic acid-binding Zn-ribbon protein
MKCPKCGYNSFEYNDMCPKCLNDLTGYKATHGLKAMALPLTARTEMARSMAAEARVEDQPAEDADMASDMFSFDFEENEQGADQGADVPIHDPFDFDDDPADSSGRAKAKEDVFTGLLETTPQKGSTEPEGKPAAANNEFDLENFSWDDTPDPAGDGKPGKPREDDFGSLFGGTKK